MKSKWLIVVLIAAACIGRGVRAEAQQQRSQEQPPEQTSFGSELVPGEAFIDKPVAISAEALSVLRSSDTVLRCLENGDTRREQVLASWFLGSEIHLDGPGEVDLIVLPNLPKIIADTVSSAQNGTCMLGAHTGPFWVLRKRDGRYEILFETNTEVLEVLDSKSNGYRDLQETTILRDRTVTITNRFDGKKYKFAERQDAPADQNH